MLSFENTEIAFKSKTNSALNNAYYLFRLIGNRQLIQLTKPFAGIAVRIPFPFRYAIKKTIYEHFCGGETIAECEHTIVDLSNYHVKTILDYSVEGKESETDFERTTHEILQTQERALLDDNVPFSVFKVTGIARFALLEKISNGEALNESEKAEFERVKNRIDRICHKAADTKRKVMVDAEETWIQLVIDQLTIDMMKKYNTKEPVVYNTYQMYRHDRLAALHQIGEQAEKEQFFVGVKLVRGAYMEKERKRALEMAYPSPIQPDKAASDRDFNAALEFLTEHIQRFAICCGSHNEHSCAYLTELMAKHQIKKQHPNVYFSQLLGMSDHISFNLASEGYNVAKYVPYGPVKDVLPYLIRRADENTSVAGQSSRELSLIETERKRRKSKK
jgi:proline dehydrogenase